MTGAETGAPDRAVTLAILGVGHWHAERHIDGFLAAGAEIVAVWDDDEAPMLRWSAQLGCRSFGRVDELLDTCRPDLVLAMPRHSAGPRILAELLERGIPFVVEKPACIDADALLPIVRGVAEAGLFTAVPFINRLSSFWTHLADARVDRSFLNPSVARFRIVNGPPSRYVNDGAAWMLDPSMSGGGALRNLGPHVIDAFLTVASGSVEILGAVLGYSQYHLEIEDHALALLRDETGMIAVVEAGYSRPDDDGSDHEWALFGEGAFVREANETVEVVTATSRHTYPTPTVVDRYRMFAARTLDQLRRGSRPDTTLSDCWNVVDLIDRIYDRARSSPSRTSDIALGPAANRVYPRPVR
jgi:predicted dehydrogenase